MVFMAKTPIFNREQLLFLKHHPQKNRQHATRWRFVRLAHRQRGPALQTRKLSPQPQRSRSLGLLNLKPSFSPSRTKSSSVPSM